MADLQCLSPVQDPLLIGAEFPFQTRLYPLGLPLDLATNDERVIEAGKKSWGQFPPAFQTRPLQVRLGVTQRTESASPPVPTFRAQGHLLSIVGDAENFAICDYTKAFAFGWMSSGVVQNTPWFRWFYLDAVILILLDQLYLTTLHAACVARQDRGILLCGASGSGKSTLSYACARSGWTFVSDDSTSLFRERNDRRAIGGPYCFHFRKSVLDILPELSGRIAFPTVNGKLTIEAPTSEFPEMKTARECDVSSLVFLNRLDKPCEARLRPVDRESAFRRLAQETAVYDEWVNGEQMRSLRRLVEIPAHELEYCDLDAAVNRLNSILE
jgi:hypothetical protein